ncbi:MAG: myo-inositol-1-phosphate synthase [Planctomycetes bacterium]|nr:myo-inositol-1-phosphate synthase [Planctomycetota bacterium]
MPSHDPAAPIRHAPRRVGLWLVGARGSISTCVAHGLEGLRNGQIEPVGLCTYRVPLNELPLPAVEDFVLGGHDVCRRRVAETAIELERERVLSPRLRTAASAAVAAYDSRIRPGVLDGADVGGADLDPESARLGSLAPLDQIAAMRADLRAFRAEHELARVVVVLLSSTEAWREPQPEWQAWGALESALREGRPQPASIVYALAALQEGCPFVNFTPNLGASPRALRELATLLRVPHCGSDGKTGETLLKTSLAPMFQARALRVLAWQGYNMLGNRDGAVLADPAHRAAKLRNKDEALRAILGQALEHSHVGIDFVPSLGDWKTALDFVHFEGFLGARMTLQLSWSGCDSALAAPLVIDLARLVEFAAENGESGALPQTACFFKSPLASPDGAHDFHAQFRELVEYAEKQLAALGRRRA